MSRFDYLACRTEEVNDTIAKLFGSFYGWITTVVLATYLTPGNIWEVLLLLWFLDLMSGTMLAIKVGRWIDCGKSFDEFPELAAVVNSGKKDRFNWGRFRLSVEKLISNILLVLGGEHFQMWITHHRPWSVGSVTFAFSLAYFMILWTDFRSIVRNVALTTGNPLLIRLWRIMGISMDLALQIRERSLAKLAKKTEPSEPPIVAGSP